MFYVKCQDELDTTLGRYWYTTHGDELEPIRIRAGKIERLAVESKFRSVCSYETWLGADGNGTNGNWPYSNWRDINGWDANAEVPRKRQSGHR